MTSWTDLKKELGGSAEAAEGYRKARVAWEFGQRVRDLRAARGWSQRDLAERIRSTQPAVARLEAGGVDPRLSTLQRLASVFDVPVTVFADRVTLSPGGDALGRVG